MYNVHVADELISEAQNLQTECKTAYSMQYIKHKIVLKKWELTYMMINAQCEL